MPNREYNKVRLALRWDITTAASLSHRRLSFGH